MTEAPLESLSGIEKLLAVMRRLREPGAGCAWDLQQHYATLTKYTLEEIYEVVEAVERQDYQALSEELGDVLFQLVFYAQIGSEAGHFSFSQIATQTADKMIARHSHVFAGKKLADTEAVIKMWETDKAKKREAAAAAKGQAASALDDVATAMPALTRAVKLQNRAARVGFAWQNLADIFTKLQEELGELQEVVAQGEAQGGEPLAPALVERLFEEYGDVLFVVANLGRCLRIDPELALRLANRKFEQRFHHMEAALAQNGQKPQDVGLEMLVALWNVARQAGVK